MTSGEKVVRIAARLRFFAIALAICCLPAFAQNHRISGKVVDALTKQPIAYAEVSIAAVGGENSPNDFSQAVRTDTEGRFLFEDLPRGKFRLSAQRHGYTAQALQEHQGFSTAIVVGAGVDSEHVLFPLLPGATISGHVSDDATGAVREAEVSLVCRTRANGRVQTEFCGAAQSNDEGFYRFAGLAAGTYFVSVSTQPWYAQFAVPKMQFRYNSNTGGENNLVIRQEPEPDEGPSALEVVYPVTYFHDTTEPTAAAAIVLRAGEEEIADFNLRAVPAARMRIRTGQSGTIREAQQPQIDFTQHGLGNFQVNIPAVTREVEPGVLEVSGLPPGPLTMHVSAAGAGNAEVFASVDASRTPEYDASEKSAGASIRATLQWANGAPVRDLETVTVQDHDTGEAKTFATKDAAFAMRIAGGKPATYDIALQGSDYAVKSLAASGAKVSGQRLELSGTQDVRLTIIIARATASVKGVALSDEKPLPGAMILLVPEDAEHNAALFRQDQSDSDGSFSLAGVVDGKYSVVAIEDGWDLDWAKPEVLAPYLTGAERVEVREGRSYQVKLKAVSAKNASTTPRASEP